MVNDGFHANILEARWPIDRAKSVFMEGEAVRLLTRLLVRFWHAWVFWWSALKPMVNRVRFGSDAALILMAGTVVDCSLIVLDGQFVKTPVKTN
jgi:hypothetical protein